MAKTPKLTEFAIAVLDADGRIGRDTVRGYVSGEFGCHREKYFWVFTHLATGVSATSLRAWCIETKALALALLAELATGWRSILPEYEVCELVDDAPWGLVERGE